MMKLVTALFALSLLPACTAWSQPACPQQQQSPDGEVQFGREACSPDGTLRIRETEPRRQGRFGIFDKGGKLVREVRVGEFDNPPKWFGFSPDGKTVGVHFHHDGGANYFAIFDVATGTLRTRIPTAEQWNFATFASDGKSLSVRSQSGKTAKIAVPQ